MKTFNQFALELIEAKLPITSSEDELTWDPKSRQTTLSPKQALAYAVSQLSPEEVAAVLAAEKLKKMSRTPQQKAFDKKMAKLAKNHENDTRLK
jgi:hypothetical protein